MKNAKLIAYKAIEMMNKNIADRKDASGKPFTPYSFSYWWQKFKAKKYKRLADVSKTEKPLNRFKSQAIAEYNQDKKNVTLADSGLMLASLAPVEVKENANNEIEITIGFKNKEAAERAFYHNYSGAGKKRVARKFLGLQKKQEAELCTTAAELLSSDSDFVKRILQKKL